MGSLLRRAAVVALLLGAALWYRSVAVEAAGWKRALLVEREENERLRKYVREGEERRVRERNAAVRAEIQQAVEGIRGLKFLRPVEYELMSRAAISGILSKKLADQFSEAEFTAIARAAFHFGLLPEGFPLRQRYLDLLSEQVAAYYDQHRHKLVLFEDASLENAQNRIILAHELTHALQDQHFGLSKLPLEIKDNDDRALAASALVEGEATFVMSQYQLQTLSLRALKEAASATLAQNMAQLEKAPRYLRELLIFPYLRGQEFCAALTAGGGYEALGRAFANLPVSTTEILHPERYLRGRVPPIEVQWPTLVFAGETAAVNNVLGEMGIRVQLGGDETAADGWRADRYLFFGKADALVWQSVWANAKEAEEFAVAERGLSAGKGRAREVRVRGAEVWLFDAPATVEALVAGFWRE